MHALLSVHDVMPETFARVADILPRISSALDEQCRKHLLLLVVPGRNWQPLQLRQMRAWQEQGFLLAGHGWLHEVREIRRLWHRLHSLVLSRRAAEHLSLAEAEIQQLMRDNHAWFAGEGLAPPDLYVPPAWALGKISSQALAETPFRYLEVTSGYIELQSGATRRLPLVGFEADTRLRQLALAISNQANLTLASHKRWLRISIHPSDCELLPGAGIDGLLGRITRSLHYAELFAAGGHGA